MIERLGPSDFTMLQVMHYYLKASNNFNTIKDDKDEEIALSNLSYLIQRPNSNNSSKHLIKSCVAVFLTPVSNPVWTQIDCSHIFLRIYFVCEHSRAPVVSNTTYLFHRRDVYCQINRVYINGKCWSVSRYSKSKMADVFIDNTLLSLNIMLTYWSLANISRYSIRVSADKDLGCLERSGFEYQRLARWKYKSNCANSNSTLHYLSSTNVSYIKHPWKTSSHFRCKDGTCILSSYVCDGYADCFDKNDEANCTDVCTLADVTCYIACLPDVCVCGEMYFHCTSQECIPLNLLCDNRQDCKDLSDERSCPQSDIFNRDSLSMKNSILVVSIDRTYKAK